MTEQYEAALRPMERKNADECNPIVLAYLGDTVYDLFVRSYLVKNRMGLIRTLHERAAGIVNAKSQAASARKILDRLTEHEHDIFLRGRNAKSSVPKNMEAADYRYATGLEAVVGYLYLTGQYSRMQEIFEWILEDFFKEDTSGTGQK